MTIREWVTMWSGRFIDEDGAYGNQCWDLAQKYCREIIGCPRLPTRPGGNGFAYDIYDYFMAPLSQYFDRIANNPANPNQVPLPGDLIIFRNSLGGHVAIVLDAPVGSSTLSVFQQNAPIGAAPGVGTLSYDGCLGWLAPKNRPLYDHAESSLSESPQLATPEMPDSDFYTIQANNTFWGLEEAWGLPHGTLQSLNAGQNPRSLRIGQQIRIRPAPLPVPVSESDPADETLYHRIVAGDTFWDLENELGLPHGRLQELNPSLNPRTLQIGQDIIIHEVATLPVEPVPLVSQIDHELALPASPVIDEPAPTSIDTSSTLATALTPVTKPSFIQRHFNKQKVLLDLGAIGTFAGGTMAWMNGHHELAAVALNIIAGLILGGNRFKGGK